MTKALHRENRLGAWGVNSMVMIFDERAFETELAKLLFLDARGDAIRYTRCRYDDEDLAWVMMAIFKVSLETCNLWQGMSVRAVGWGRSIVGMETSDESCIGSQI